MKKAKRKFHKSKHQPTAFNKSTRQVEAELIKQVVPIKPERLNLDYVKPQRRT